MISKISPTNPPKRSHQKWQIEIKKSFACNKIDKTLRPGRRTKTTDHINLLYHSTVKFGRFPHWIWIWENNYWQQVKPCGCVGRQIGQCHLKESINYTKGQLRKKWWFTSIVWNFTNCTRAQIRLMVEWNSITNTISTIDRKWFKWLTDQI